MFIRWLCSNCRTWRWWWPSTTSARWSARRWSAGSRWDWTVLERRSWPTGTTCDKCEASRSAVGMSSSTHKLLKMGNIHLKFPLEIAFTKSENTSHKLKKILLGFSFLSKFSTTVLQFNTASFLSCRTFPSCVFIKKEVSVEDRSFLVI